MKPITEKERSKKIAQMVKLAEGWLSKGYSLEKIEMGLWNSFGYNMARYEDRIEIRSNGVDYKVYATICAE